jgi:hypothetical protein
MNVKDFNADTHFYELTELADLSLQELQALWDTVPSEEQAYLVRVFEREADKRQVVEDLIWMKHGWHAIFWNNIGKLVLCLRVMFG